MMPEAIPGRSELKHFYKQESKIIQQNLRSFLPLARSKM